MKLPIFILTLCCSFLITPKNCNATAPADSSISKYNKYKTHILTLDYISRKTNNSKYFLNMAGKYCDSLMIIGKDSAWAQAFKEKIELTLITCEYNMNHKIQLFPYFNGMPPFMGFADDVIEYAYDNALEELFNTTFKKIHNGPLSKANISSIIVRGECDDEMFEIVRQTILSNTSHYIVTSEKLNQLLGTQKTKDLTNGIRDNESMNIICKSLKLENLGVFYVTNMDNIDEKIWLVHTEFSTYSPDNGIAEAVFSRGFSQDKRDVLGINILLLILESILFIALIAVFDEIIIKFIRTRKLFSAKEIFFQFVKKLKFVSICFATPTLLSFVMIYSLSFLSPDPADHFKEYNSILWIIVLTLGMSIIPLFLNLFLINRLQLDGFHNIRGYRTFANASLYATYLPIFVFYIIQFEREPIISLFLLVVLTFVIGDLLARSYFQFTSKSKHRNLKTQAVSGLIIGILALIFFNTYALTEISPTVFISSLVFIAPLSLIHWGMGKYMDRINEKKLESSTERTLLSDLKFIKDVIDPSKDIYERINNSISKENLNLMIVAAPMGIGKTRSLEEAKEIFTKNKWNWYYGDCDEIQDENTISFEPFIEAFKDLLKVQEFTDRSQHMENISGDAIKAMADITGAGSDMISELKRDENRSMTEICVEIAEKLEASKNKTVFVMEDLHWIDPESYAFLKHFIKTINRNEFIRGNLCIILTLRNDQVSNYRGVDYKKLMGDLKDLDEQLESKTIIEDLLTEQQFNVKDFINHISKQNKQFKIQDDSLADINYKLNSALSDNKDKLTITPLYILKVIEQWIQNKVLKYTPDGYVLTSSIDSMELPNTDEIDSYYHSIFDLFEPKWQRVLESAAIIGNKFDADILAKVWGYELLDILAFLEIAVKNNLLKDLTSEDNIYEFADKRIITAIKSYFITSDIIESDKQIVREYNKRYILLHQDLIENSHLYSVEELLRIVRRVTPLVSSKKYSKQLEKLILEIVIRHLYKLDFQGLKVFSDFFKDKKGLKLISYLIESIAIISNDDLMIKEREDRYENVVSRKPFSMVKEFNFEIELLIILKLYYKEGLLNKKELDFINKKMESHYREIVLLNITIKISNQKSDFKYSFNLLEKFLEKNKNSLHFDSYDRRIKTHFLWKHSLNNQIQVNEKKYGKGSASSYWGTWPESVKELSDLDIINKGYLLLENSNDAITNESIIALLLMINSNLNMKNETIKIYSELSEYIPNESQNLKLIVGLKIRLLGNEHFLDFKKETQNDIIVFVEKYIQRRYDTSHFNKFIELYIINKLSFYKKINNLEEYKILLDSYLQKVESSLGQENRSYASVCSKYSEYFESQNDYENELIWLDKRLNTYSLFSGKNGVLNKSDKLMVHTLSTQFILKSYKNSILLNKAKLYAEQLLISSDESDKNSFDYGDSCVLNAFVYEKLKEYGNSAQYFDKAAEYFESSNAEDKEWRVAFYSLRSSLNLVELDRDMAISKLKVSLDNILSDKFKNIRADRHAAFIKKAQLILRK